MANFGKLFFLRYGDLNNLRENDDNATGDRRRTSPITALRMATEKAFQKSTLQSIDEFRGIVVGKRWITYATAAYPYTLLSLASTEDTDTTFTNYLYRVYIPELEPLPPPQTSSDPVLLGYQEIPVDMVISPGLSCKLGDVVVVKYDDVQLLNNPKIVKKISSNPPNWSAPPRVASPQTGVTSIREVGDETPPEEIIITGPPGSPPAQEIISTSLPGEPCNNPHGFPVPSDMPKLSPPEAWHKRKQNVKKVPINALQWHSMTPIVAAVKPLLDWIGAGEGGVNSVNRTGAGDTPGGSAAYITSGSLIGRQLSTLTFEQASSLHMGYKNRSNWIAPGENAKYVDMDKAPMEKNKVAEGKLNGESGRVPDNVVRQWLDSGHLASSNASWKNNGFFTLGKYQFIPATYAAALSYIDGLVTSTALFNSAAQDKLGVALLFRKRRRLGGYLLGLHDNVGLAVAELAMEWRSIGIAFANVTRNGNSDVSLTDPQPLAGDVIVAKVGQVWVPGPANTEGAAKHTPCEAVQQLRLTRAKLLTDPAAVAALQASGFSTSDQFLNNVPYEE